MKKYGVNELRRMYLDFFASKGHLVMKSFSLVPHNDNSLLLINAGMAPLKPYFTGRRFRPGEGWLHARSASAREISTMWERQPAT